MAQFIRGIRAIEAARHGAPLYVFNRQRGWVPAGPGALDRAERIIDINARMGVPYTDVGLGDYGVPGKNVGTLRVEITDLSDEDRPHFRAELAPSSYAKIGLKHYTGRGHVGSTWSFVHFYGDGDTEQEAVDDLDSSLRSYGISATLKPYSVDREMSSGWQENPVKAGGISLETGLLIAGGVALLGGIGYLIYNAVQQANATAAATNAQLAQTNATGQQLAATAQQAQQLLPGSSSTLPYYAIPGTPPAVQAAGNQAAAASVGL